VPKYWTINESIVRLLRGKRFTIILIGMEWNEPTFSIKNLSFPFVLRESIQTENFVYLSTTISWK
jgi:hypothetical protein